MASEQKTEGGEGTSQVDVYETVQTERMESAKILRLGWGPYTGNLLLLCSRSTSYSWEGTRLRSGQSRLWESGSPLTGCVAVTQPSSPEVSNSPSVRLTSTESVLTFLQQEDGLYELWRTTIVVLTIFSSAFSSKMARNVNKILWWSSYKDLVMRKQCLSYLNATYNGRIFSFL